MTCPPNLHSSDPKSTRLYSYTQTKRPLPPIDNYSPYYPDPEYGFDPYWDVHHYNKHDLCFYQTFDKHNNEIEPASHDLDDTLNCALNNALVDPGQAKRTSVHLTAQNDPQDKNSHNGIKISLTAEIEACFAHMLVMRTGEPDYVPLATNLGLRHKRRKLYFPMDFGELTLDGFVDTGALSSAIPDADLRRIRSLAPQTIVKEGPAPNFQIMVANGQLENPKSTVELKFEVGDIEFHEIFIVMEKLTSPLFGLSYLQRNNTILDMRQGFLTFPFFSMQLKTADHKYTNVMERICIREDVTITPNDRLQLLESSNRATHSPMMVTLPLVLL